MDQKYIDYAGQPQKVIQPWKAALYIRLSKEDLEKKNESVSVTNQREILVEYLRQHPEIELFDIYVDDGFTGTDFDRPAWTRLKADIESGYINCVVVKDLNRFGRNYTVGGDLIDNYFARKNVRFIALNNGVDTADDNMNAATRCISIGVTNVINESYSAMTSVSIRGTLNNHRKQGKFIGAFACYGYMKSPDDYHKLVVDEEAAEVVRMIYHKFIDGMSLIGITKQLNALGIPNPTLYKQQKGYNFNARGGKNDGLWCDRTVRRILQNEMYIGNMVQGRNKTVSYKVHECKAVPKDDWIVVENTHEPIIDKETFDKAQSLFNRHIRSSPVTKQTDLFSGLVRCADCGAVMSKKTNKLPYGTYRYYKCSTKRKQGKCTNHTIRIDKLENAVLTYLQTMVKLAVEYDRVMEQVNSNRINQKTNSMKKALDAQLKERDKYQKAMLDLYPDWKANIITQDEYLMLKANLTEKITKLDEMIENLKHSHNNVTPKNNDFVEHFKQYKNIDKLTRPMLVELIDSILIHEGNRITIKVKFIDALEELLRNMEKAA
ncbi:MAG: recombinase family protein [Ruminococcus sp.]|nr:recombinase family protein [Ruminococcus sp.]